MEYKVIFKSFFVQVYDYIPSQSRGQALGDLIGRAVMTYDTRGDPARMTLEINPSDPVNDSVIFSCVIEVAGISDRFRANIHAFVIGV